MSERGNAGRSPDAGYLLGRGDARIQDFLAQQQGAADLADFALQSAAGATLGDATALGGSPVGTTLPLTDINLTDWGVGGGTLVTTTAVLDPVGENISLLMTPDGVTTNPAMTSPFYPVPAGTDFIHFKAGIQAHRVAEDLQVSYFLTWADDSGAQVLPGDLVNTNVQQFVFNAAKSDTWLHVDDYIPVPTGATQLVLSFSMTRIDSGVPEVGALVYVNGISVLPASIFTGAHEGLVTQRAAWWLPWGRVGGGYLTINQTNADITEHEITGVNTGFTAVFGRNYRITVSGAWRILAAGAITLRLKWAGVTQLGNDRRYAIPTANDDRQITFSEEYGLFTPGSIFPIRVTQQSSVASGVTCAAGNAPLTVSIDDIGPNSGFNGGRPAEDLK